MGFWVPHEPTYCVGPEYHEPHGALCRALACQAFGVPLLNPVVNAAALTGALANAPLRFLEDLAAPARIDLAKVVRRSIGLGKAPISMSMDPAESYVRPDGVARMVHSDLPSMLIGGIGALLLQTLHPSAMAGVAEHSNYQADPLGRLRRTANFVGTTTFGTVREAEKAIAQVRSVHRRVNGIAPGGRPYSASDPELVTFIHTAEVSSFLESSRRFGARDLSPEQCDEYYDEMAPVALALGAIWVPRSAADVTDYFRQRRSELYATDQARQARDWLRHGVTRRPNERAVFALLHAAAVSTLPDWARAELELTATHPIDLLRETVAVIPASRALSAVLRWVATPPPPNRDEGSPQWSLRC
jgi:uncharacterized protein (DUF2236 family)